MTTIIGFEVRPLRVDYAIHKKNLIEHVFKTDGFFCIPSSMLHSEANHKEVLLQGLRGCLGQYQTEIHDIGVYVGEYTERKKEIRLRPDWREEELLQSMKWLYEGITTFFEIETMDIPIEGTARFRRRAMKSLELLTYYNGYTRLYANWVAFEGAKEVENI